MNQIKAASATADSIEDAIQILADHVNIHHDLNVQAYLDGKPTRSQKGFLRSQLKAAIGMDALLHYQNIGLSGDRTGEVWSVYILSATP